jgi:forkhead transcription factor HCM1
MPLQEHSNAYNQLTETPISKSYLQNSAITTPPETSLHIKKKRLSIETPITRNFDGGAMMSNSILLSPAFLSPQQQQQLHPPPSLMHHLLQFEQHQVYHTASSIQALHGYASLHMMHQAYSHTMVPPMSSMSVQHTQYDPLEITAPPKPSFQSVSLRSISVAEVDNSQQPKKRLKKSKKDLKNSPFDLDSDDKPPYSYATLIGMSILSHPEKKLTLSLIYQWISDTFRYYKREDVGWQNSIRHNLSLNKAFLKGEKSKDGKGHFWCIQIGCEDQFLKSRNSKRHLYQEIMDHIQNKPLSNAHTNSFSNSSFSGNSLTTTKKSINSLPSSPNISNESEVLTEDIGTLKPSFKNVASYHSDHDDDEGNGDVTQEDILQITPIQRHKRTKLASNDDAHEPASDLGAPFSHLSRRSHNDDMPKFVLTESPDKPLLAGKNLTYTSSFSCNSNLELSPIRPSETGPLLEPLTPINNVYKRMSALSDSLPQSHADLNYYCNQQQHPLTSNHSQQQQNAQLQSHQPTKQATGSHQLLPYIASQSPFHGKNYHSKSQSQSQTPHQCHHTNSLSHMHLPQVPGHPYVSRTPKSNLRTPMGSLRSPQTSSILKKLCYSPSYIDDFYYSPSVSSASHVLNSYDDDDLISRAFESPAAKRLHATMNSGSRKLFGEFKKVDSISTEEMADANGKEES